MIRLPAESFDLALTLESGQVFHWDLLSEWYVLPQPAGMLRVRQAADELLVEPSGGVVDVDAVSSYFGVTDEASDILSAIDVDPFMHEAMVALDGLRVMQQPIWDCLLAFLLTPANNIARIRLMARRLRETFGQPYELVDGDAAMVAYSLPTAAAIASSSEKVLRGLGLGWRAPFVLRTARMVETDGRLRYCLRCPTTKPSSGFENFLELARKWRTVCCCLVRSTMRRFRLMFGCVGLSSGCTSMVWLVLRERCSHLRLSILVNTLGMPNNFCIIMVG